MNGLSDLRTVGSQHTMSRVWDGPQRHVTTLMLLKFVKSCVLIVVWQCERYSKSVQHIDGIMSWHSYDKIRNALGNFKVCPTTSDTGSERQSRCHLSRTSGLRWRGRQLSEKNYNRRWNKGLWIRCGNENAVPTMGCKKFADRKMRGG
jgi:hypothetical protein